MLNNNKKQFSKWGWRFMIENILSENRFVKYKLTFQINLFCFIDVWTALLENKPKKEKDEKCRSRNNKFKPPEVF